MFKLHSKFEPTGDQPEAIKGLVEGIQRGEKYQTLLRLLFLKKYRINRRRNELGKGYIRKNSFFYGKE